MSATSAKALIAENGVVSYLLDHGWPYAERRRTHGMNDKGDVSGTPGICWEVKGARNIDLPGWLRETERERVNANADVGVLVVKTKGYGEPRAGEWAAVVPLSVMTDLLRRAGYGDSLEETA
jgi:hypothetical protein